MWHRTPDLRLSLVNSAYVRAVDGADAREVIGSGVELVEAVGGLTPQAAAADALARGEPIERMVPATIDGERRTMRVVDVPLGEAGVAGYAVDQHQLEQARVEHRRLEAAQRDLLDRLSAGVARFGPDRALRFWNQPFISLFGLHQDQLADAPCSNGCWTRCATLAACRNIATFRHGAANGATGSCPPIRLRKTGCCRMAPICVSMPSLFPMEACC